MLEQSLIGTEFEDDERIGKIAKHNIYRGFVSNTYQSSTPYREQKLKLKNNYNRCGSEYELYQSFASF